MCITIISSVSASSGDALCGPTARTAPASPCPGTSQHTWYSALGPCCALHARPAGNTTRARPPAGPVGGAGPLLGLVGIAQRTRDGSRIFRALGVKHGDSTLAPAWPARNIMVCKIYHSQFGLGLQEDHSGIGGWLGVPGTHGAWGGDVGIRGQEGGQGGVGKEAGKIQGRERRQNTR